ncbi:hypothetical protein FRC17_003402 [Serendipita sp. 399]|nr:hypothetical protein FRC17_003402 [Serendipita sp. 399]
MAAYLPDVLHVLKTSPTTTNGTFHPNERIELLENIFLHLRASQYTLFAGVVIYIYDIFMTFDDEISLIWSKKARKGFFIKTLFFLIFVESVVAGMTVLHAVQLSKKDMETGMTIMPILKALYLNGFIYYIIVLLLRLGSVFVYYTAPPTLILLICYFEYAVTSAVTSRSILTFRQVLTDTLGTRPDGRTATNVTHSSWQRSHDGIGRRGPSTSQVTIYSPSTLTRRERIDDDDHDDRTYVSVPVVYGRRHAPNDSRDTIAFHTIGRGSESYSRRWATEHSATGEQYYHGRPSTSSAATETETAYLVDSPDFDDIGRAY